MPIVIAEADISQHQSGAFAPVPPPSPFKPQSEVPSSHPRTRPLPDSQPPRKGEVPAQPGVGAPAFPPVSSTASLPWPSPFNPQSQVQNPQSEALNSHPRARPQVPLTFSPIINDEANILAAIARGERTIPDLAEEHATTITALCLWLQREDIQRKLADLTTAGATLTRIAAANQLPKAVSALSFQIDGYIFDRTHNLIKPGLDADRVAATRDANVRKAAHLLLRLAKFDPNQPVYRRRERAESSTLAPRVAVRANPSTLTPQGSAQRGEDGGVASAQHEPVRGVLNTPAQFAATPLPSTSHFPLPTSHIALPPSPIPDPSRFPPRSRPPPPD